MAVSPHAFYKAIGPFGTFNAHYLRDVASFEGALGLALVVALARPSWRVPVLALTTAQFALHSVNHLVDIGRAHPRWTGYFDFFSLAAATVVLAWLWRVASMRGRPPRASARRGRSRTSPVPLRRKEHHMSRIEGVPEQEANPLVRVIYRLVRHELAQDDRPARPPHRRHPDPRPPAPAAHRLRAVREGGRVEAPRGRAPARARGAEVGGHAGVRDVPGHRLPRGAHGGHLRGAAARPVPLLATARTSISPSASCSTWPSA